jgi:hypothetical protein
VGIAEDILVRIRNSFIPVDFMVLEMDVCCQIPVILGRLILSTARVTIDVAVGIIKLNISEKEETFTFKPKGAEQCNLVMTRIKLERNAMTPDKKSSAVDIESRPNLGYCIPLCGFLAVIQLVRNRGHEAE